MDSRGQRHLKRARNYASRRRVRASLFSRPHSPSPAGPAKHRATNQKGGRDALFVSIVRSLHTGWHGIYRTVYNFDEGWHNSCCITFFYVISLNFVFKLKRIRSESNARNTYVVEWNFYMQRFSFEVKRSFGEKRNFLLFLFKTRINGNN